ncbi:unnamed protein product [Lampetra fluviatilis]
METEITTDEEGKRRESRTTRATRVAEGDRDDRAAQLMLAADEEEAGRAPREMNATCTAEGARDDRVGQTVTARDKKTTWRKQRATDTTCAAGGDWGNQTDPLAAGGCVEEARRRMEGNAAEARQKGRMEELDGRVGADGVGEGSRGEKGMASGSREAGAPERKVGNEARETPATLRQGEARRENVTVDAGPVGAGRPRERDGKWRRGAGSYANKVRAYRVGGARDEEGCGTKLDPDKELVREGRGEVAEQQPPATDGGGEGERHAKRAESTSSEQEEGLAGEGSDGMGSISETTVEDWAEAVEEDEEKGERQQEEGGSETWEGPIGRKRRIRRAPKRGAPSGSTESSDSSPNTEASREGMEERVESRRRGKPLRTRGKMKLRELANEDGYGGRAEKATSD